MSIVIKTATALVGDFYVTSTDDMERVFGHFNSLLDKKLIVQLNEAEGSQGSKFISKIKGHVTQDVNHIKEEHIKPRAQKNNVRFIVNSNNLNPIPEDRRTPIIQTRVDILISKEWWADYYTNKLTSQHFLNSLGSDLMDVDLSKVNIMCPPETAANKTKKMQKITPAHRLFQKLAEGVYDSSPGVHELVKLDDTIGIRKTWLVEELMKHSNEHYQHKEQAKKLVESWASEYPEVIDLHGKHYVNGTQMRLVTMRRQAMVNSLKNSDRYVPKDEEEDFQFSS
jgi:hypothetical protein